ncbi:MAG TPA: 23S rRNA (guanosine(2251)-2'-O)-methyltransferase RlmB [Methylococcaceae bacterium]|nr:23S rRNA (guanosine(2251)-2'-O)-methyltransferase RlmB [Methylococcaceae bacterium]HIN69048.1 23S rRNA (guanosine(2251)-2'-O)-methyltransferase RlmB [Methylococcales bacterium]HIA44856.1 23S rRNA (guanosine(2251)-2'-O)-methyltransferase RlmB [Methylococcaceae bacterium]HIB63291.1 23S rRNA (guanosine(2251)-2'-O)-methyltransferase RlmB [Methylococcaceae bacterium]HIO13177.1 23S rRNA (guanosine(2251)-2'-O)-methyltransferase RlmB [Methylococcales bacterium]
MKATIIVGIHAVQSALDYSVEKIQGVWVDGSRQDAKFQELVKQLAGLEVPFHKTNKKTLEQLSKGRNHQGVLVEVDLPTLKTEKMLMEKIKTTSETPFFLVLDQVQDPHNLGACLRTADAVGVQGVILPKDNSAGLTPTVCKVASGAAETVPVYQVTNLARILRWMKQQGIWVMGAAGEASQTVFQIELTGPLAFVVGAEGKGLRRLTREQCDVLVKLPMLGQVESLNLSVASGILLYEALRQRGLA